MLLAEAGAPQLPAPERIVFLRASFWSGAATAIAIMVAAAPAGLGPLAETLGAFVQFDEADNGVLFSSSWREVGAALDRAWPYTAVFAALLFVTTFLVRRREVRLVQARRDRFARDVVAYLRQGGTAPPPFSLYLRPFFTDGQLTANEGLVGYNLFDATSVAEFGERKDAERAASSALSETAPLIAIGKPNGRLGAGRAETADDTWQELFRLLAGHAKQILMVPIAQPATASEMEHIAATPELLKKTIFVRPANRVRLGFRFNPSAKLKSLASIWNHSRTVFQPTLPHFPLFSGGPRFFVFADRLAKPSEYRGNMVASVQTTSGARRFLVQHERRPQPSVIALMIWAIPLAVLWFAPWDWFFISGLTTDHEGGSAIVPIALLMFSLVVAGYRLATGDFPYFGTQRALFIAAAVVTVQVVGFPLSSAATSLDAQVADLNSAIAQLDQMSTEERRVAATLGLDTFQLENAVEEHDNLQRTYGWTESVFGNTFGLTSYPLIRLVTLLAFSSSIALWFSALAHVRMFWLGTAIGLVAAIVRAGFDPVINAVFIPIDLDYAEMLESHFAARDAAFQSGMQFDQPLPESPWELTWGELAVGSLTTGATIIAPQIVLLGIKLDLQRKTLPRIWLWATLTWVGIALAIEVVRQGLWAMRDSLMGAIDVFGYGSPWEQVATGLLSPLPISFIAVVLQLATGLAVVGFWVSRADASGRFWLASGPFAKASVVFDR